MLTYIYLYMRSTSCSTMCYVRIMRLSLRTNFHGNRRILCSIFSKANYWFNKNSFSFWLHAYYSVIDWSNKNFCFYSEFFFFIIFRFIDQSVNIYGFLKYLEHPVRDIFAKCVTKLFEIEHFFRWGRLLFSWKMYNFLFTFIIL